MEQAPALTIGERWDATVAIATVRGEIDINTVGILSEHLGRLARKNPQRLVIDLAGVSFIDSSGLGGFVRIRKGPAAGLPGRHPLTAAPGTAALQDHRARLGDRLRVSPAKGRAGTARARQRPAAKPANECHSSVTGFPAP